MPTGVPAVPHPDTNIQTGVGNLSEEAVGRHACSQTFEEQQ